MREADARKKAIEKLRLQADMPHVERYVEYGASLARLGMTGFAVPKREGVGKRKQVTDISAGARARLLRAIAEIDWEEHLHGSFITLTLPDEYAALDYATLTKCRHVFIRHVEKEVGKQVPMIWRKEYKPRKTGIHKGKMAPHYHLACLAKVPIEWERMLELWQKSIGTKAYVSVDIIPVKDAQHAAFYMAKYLTKEEGSGILDYYTYLNSTGRVWGWHRKSAMVKVGMTKTTGLTLEAFDELNAIACAIRGTRAEDCPLGQTLIGTTAKVFIEEIEKIQLDKGDAWE